MNGFGMELSGLTVLAAIAWICALGWLVFAGVALHGLAGRKPLLPMDASHRKADAPLVSVLMPARNEAQRVLARSVRSVLAQDYERLEVIVVDDRSTDDTGSILRSIAETDGRLRVIDGLEPPAGWLGKPYALQQALDAARGQWVLTIDADMVLEKEAVGVAVGRALALGQDVLTLMPYFETESFWERVFTPAWMLILLVAYPFANFGNPKMKPPVAFGGFMLIRREALAGLGDFAAVRAEVVEDVWLAGLLKSSGARYRIEHAPNLIRTRMQNGFREIWDFLSRCMFASMRQSLALSALYILTGYAFVVAPALIAAFCLLMLAVGASGQWWSLLAVPSITIWASQVIALIFICRNLRIPLAYALTTPLGLSLFYTALLISIINILRGRGVGWKERKVYERTGAGLAVGDERTVSSSTADK
ncbi:MAG TPA: glycosyltransferase [Pyrinomonadaceae bacterium]|jgi:cellulose synthase/poly-beta-1,6-N-acetylglucosamine synthase-like glycosyltransferase